MKCLLKHADKGRNINVMLPESVCAKVAPVSRTLILFQEWSWRKVIMITVHKSHGGRCSIIISSRASSFAGSGCLLRLHAAARLMPAKNYCYYLYVGKWVTKYTLMTFCVTLPWNITLERLYLWHDSTPYLHNLLLLNLIHPQSKQKLSQELLRCKMNFLNSPSAPLHFWFIITMNIIQWKTLIYSLCCWIIFLVPVHLQIYIYSLILFVCVIQLIVYCLL